MLQRKLPMTRTGGEVFEQGGGGMGTRNLSNHLVA